MIIFDTNVLYGLHRGSPQFDLLMAFKHSGSYQISIPWMVCEELVAKQVLEYEDAYDKADAAAAALVRKMPWGSPVGFPRRAVEMVKKYWRDQYEEILEILETSGDNAKTALAREAYCQKPAKTDPRSKGNGLALSDHVRAEQVKLDFPGDVGDAGLAGLAGGEVAGFLGLAGAGPVRAVAGEGAGGEDLEQERGQREIGLLRGKKPRRCPSRRPGHAGS